MSDDDAEVPRDPIHVSLDRDEEVAYWMERFDCDRDELEDAVEVAGTSVMRVMRYIAVSRGI